MPLYIDPDWEYWSPDPEIVEILDYYEEARYSFAHKGLLNRDSTASLGVRFGTGSPDRGGWGRLAPDPDKYKYKEEKPSNWRQCPCCHNWFVANYDRRIYCSRQCWKPKILTSRNCLCCGEEFTPAYSSRRYCSIECSGKHKTKAPGRSPPPNTVLQKFQEMYMGGKRMDEISKELSVTTRTLKLWRKKLGLVARPRGNQKKRA